MQKSVGIGLYVLSGQESYDRVGWVWSASTSQVSESVFELVSALCKVAPVYIAWPEGIEVDNATEAFEIDSRLPDCIGALLFPTSNMFATCSYRAAASDYILVDDIWRKNKGKTL
ncbi:hypothetical protein T492DRAFT_934971 [Pavlovales sp. CCMP2436]|nr:hypothetical protein T492DRAFT_934971 [Pavlovales sp. CCMP2436]|eukprot:CAMPEP_0179857698 /NCGR_PEP_ID=MMETSP0982-20121206/11912_1 /TAXON_ID=483367 /ORGANISM="non described non described, Strain CCMP 2436" /LENGTH=114 /DNA_ID=CAMNT_0021744281 /DNA_START=246 /DNA_END=590 /DNA_ORIENTATION=-